MVGFSSTELHLGFTGLDLVLLGLLRWRWFWSIGSGQNHPLTELCRVKGHSEYTRIIILNSNWLVLMHCR